MRKINDKHFFNIHTVNYVTYQFTYKNYTNTRISKN